MPTELEREIADLEARLADLEARWPAHSITPALLAALDELEEQLTAARRVLAAKGTNPETQART